jgi:hypothetical protein
MTGVPILNALAVLTRRGQIVARLADVAGLMEQTGKGESRVELRGVLTGRSSYWLADGVELEVTWTIGPGRRSGRIGATLEVLRYDIETGQVSLAGVVRLQIGGPWTGPITAE